MLFALLFACCLPDAPLVAPKPCPKIPYHPPSKSLEEKPEVCIERDGIVYFGLGFYDGEGMTGIGGLGRFDPSTKKKLAVRRPRWLRDKSVSLLALDGDVSWLAAIGQFEKETMEYGIARYDWNRNELKSFGACGLEVTDLRVDGDTLLVSDGKFVARFDLRNERWITDCHARFRRLLERTKNCRYPECENELPIETIARFDPSAVREFLASRPIDRDEYARLAGQLARSRAELQRAVKRAPEMWRRTIIESFEKR